MGTETLREIFQSFVLESGKDLSWKWDSYCDAVMCQFETDQASVFDALFLQRFLPPWHMDNIQDAPSLVSQIVGNLGGLREQQKMFVTSLDESVVLVAAWWPWGNGSKISLRLFLWSSEPEKTADLAFELRSWFAR